MGNLCMVINSPPSWMYPNMIMNEILIDARKKRIPPDRDYSFNTILNDPRHDLEWNHNRIHSNTDISMIMNLETLWRMKLLMQIDSPSIWTNRHELEFYHKFEYIMKGPDINRKCNPKRLHWNTNSRMIMNSSFISMGNIFMVSKSRLWLRHPFHDLIWILIDVMKTRTSPSILNSRLVWRGKRFLVIHSKSLARGAHHDFGWNPNIFYEKKNIIMSTNPPSWWKGSLLMIINSHSWVMNNGQPDHANRIPIMTKRSPQWFWAKSESIL